MRESSARPRPRAAVLEGAALGLIASLVAFGFAGCGGVGDESFVPARGVPVNQADLASAPYCVGTCTPDYGSQRIDIDCTAEAGLEFFPVDVFNGDTGVVTGFYAYNDGSSEFMVAGPTGYQTTLDNYGPPTVAVDDRCGENGERAPNQVHHIRGGLFREWGGGIGRRLVDFVTASGGGACAAGPSRPEDPGYCPDADPRIEDAIANGANPALRGQFYGMTADLRDWEGISFWARQGPNNTGGIRVYLGDRQLDEDIAYLEAGAGLEPLCGRSRACSCRNHKPCTPGDGGLVQSFCWDPNEIESIAAVRQEYLARGEQTLFELRYPLCGASACDDQNDAFQAPDPVFATAANPTSPGTAECLPYKLTNDLEDSFCYDRDNPATYPPDGPDSCGDGWAKGVALSTDWQLYKVPFTELRQEGFGKEFSYLDLSKITLVRFTWSQGWVDVWLDDVRFYRQAGTPAGE